MAGPFPNDPVPGALLRRFRILQQRYGAALPPGLAGLETAIATRRHQADRLDRRIGDLVADKGRLAAEIEGLERGIEATLAAEVQRIEAHHAEGWSPTPVIGYRWWWILDRGLVGARRHRWPLPVMTASCDRLAGAEEIPHSDGRCGRLGCGIYAVKDRRRLNEEGGWSTDGVVGLVELAGKVVEHDHGYRAAHAEVKVVGAVIGNRSLVTADPGRIVALFDDPERALLRWGDRAGSSIEGWLRVGAALQTIGGEQWT